MLKQRKGELVFEVLALANELSKLARKIPNDSQIESELIVARNSLKILVGVANGTIPHEGG